jgi:hypothetical protein
LPSCRSSADVERRELDQARQRLVRAGELAPRTGEERQRLLLEALRQVETEPGLLGVSAHLLTVARCPL